MSQIECFECDVCGLVWAPGKHEWEDNGKGGELNIFRDGVNGGIRWKSLCRGCRISLIDAVLDKAKELYQSKRGKTEIRYKAED